MRSYSYGSPVPHAIIEQFTSSNSDAANGNANAMTGAVDATHVGNH